ncbi:hypothetical protein BH11MYX1_BH11MYX1_38050 [soil metagenome]
MAVTGQRQLAESSEIGHDRRHVFRRRPDGSGRRGSDARFSRARFPCVESVWRSPIYLAVGARERRDGRGVARRRSADRTRGRGQDHARRGQPQRCGAVSSRSTRPGSTRPPERGPGPRSRPERQRALLRDETAHRHDVARRHPEREARVDPTDPANSVCRGLPRDRIRAPSRHRPSRLEASEHHAGRFRRDVRARLGAGEGLRGR